MWRALGPRVALAVDAGYEGDGILLAEISRPKRWTPPAVGDDRVAHDVPSDR